MQAGYPRLLGDIGGTHARWAWQADPGQAPQRVSVQACADHPNIHESALAYLAVQGLPAPAWVGIGIAAPPTGDMVHMTNNPWSFSISDLRRRVGAERCLVVNDFTALAMSLPALQADELRPLGRGQALEGAPLALIGPGTGLGVSGLLPQMGGGWQALSGEGGHVTLAAMDDDEAAVLAVLRRRHAHVSAERALSGPGLVDLYNAVAELDGQPMRLQRAAEVGAAVVAGEASALRTVSLFAGFLGNVAGNLVLTLGARGGVYIGGGVVPKLGEHFDAARFRERFEGKGRYVDYLRPVPAYVILAPAPALIGASRALDANLP